MKLKSKRRSPSGVPDGFETVKPDSAPEEIEDIEEITDDKLESISDIVINPTTGRPYRNPKKVGKDPIGAIIKKEIKEAEAHLKEFGPPNIFSYDIATMEINKQPILSPDEMKKLKSDIRSQFEQTVAQVTGNGAILLQKALELATGVKIRKKGRDGKDLVYDRPPDMNAIDYLTKFLVGNATGLEKQAETGSTGSNITQVNVYIPDNGRGDGPKPIEAAAIPAKFKEEDEEIIDGSYTGQDEAEEADA